MWELDHGLSSEDCDVMCELRDKWRTKIALRKREGLEPKVSQPRE